MKSALIVKLESRETGWRVADIVEKGNEFPVGEGFFWIDCEDYIENDQYWYDPFEKSIKEFPKPDPIPDSIAITIV